MNTIRFRSWTRFRQELTRYAALDEGRRGQLLFRGQSDSGYDLLPTMDRDGRNRRRWGTDAARDAAAKGLLEAFQREAVLAGHGEAASLEADALELLARHHALPSQLLDFTRSPFVAAYFAFAHAGTRGRCTVWQVDRAVLPQPLPEVEVIEDPMLIRFNIRALRQRGVFIKLKTGTRTLADLADASITRYDVSVDQRAHALAELEEMGINAASLFGDLDAVAATATGRVAMP